MEIFLGWAILAVVVGVIAGNRGRSGFGWFLLSLLLSPLIGLILVLALRAPNVPVVAGPSPDTHVKCPDCRELVLKEARVCKHCGCKLVPQTE